ncbi:AAA family ATPase [Bhargavaea beijingensis]|uniref:AAA family ATPase n=1 Tax=Bhargavaea beijingensis TaxID=426756 RepID=A0A1G7BLA7_9BACL|nr:AAA family ATPase [Bhargavaea beijingensis]MCW1926779.1 AAA family ATPase [Bhargavaea beijingensis]RSK36971.1 AAA family ATPase [Bhargavaea beijingensis]SDE27809.1 MoxR-like ATPase [Bhargavaea beijingensis]
MGITKEDYREMSLIIGKVKEEVGTFIVGQEEAVDFILYSILAGGHTLLEGLPGLGKTMLIRTFSEVLDLGFSRIQFTPDLMPSDITGTTVIEETPDGRKDFVFREGPLFSEMVLADEINRATPKTQSALLEAMGERTVTVLGTTRPMKEPFFVLATQNPIELEGTYPLPEAQLDRFLCKVIIPNPETEELKEIIRRTTGSRSVGLRKLMGPEEIRRARKMVREVILPEEMLDVAARIVTGTHPDDSPLDEVRRWIRFGSGPRGLQSLVLAAKARALAEGRFHVSIGDLKKCAVPALRHRLLFNYEGEAAGIPADELITRLADMAAGGRMS